jgi:N-acyl-D-aspartate/D-glutamate deacylase
MLDLIIRNGTIVDGTGSPGRRGDLGIHDGRIAAIGEIDDSASRTIDADGKVVAPGFVDIHTHYDAQAFWDTTLSPSPLHGVTTVIGGNCGFTIAPLEPEHADYLLHMLARVEGMPVSALQEGVPWNWRSFGEYLDKIDGTLAPNAGFLVGHARPRVKRRPTTLRRCRRCSMRAWRKAALASRRVGRAPTTTPRATWCRRATRPRRNCSRCAAS